jgi:hypothetical protein
VVQRKDTGRPEVVYGRKAKDLLHEVMVAELEVVTGMHIERGAKVGATEADGRIAELGLFVELDNSAKMTKRMFEVKWKRYSGTDGDILVVCLDEGRMERVRKFSEAVKDRALFTTFARLRTQPEPWIDWMGNTTAL